jgi:DMSO/TMAO reductase YedYZ molybdopterin-dependent catalytic subunit
MSGYASELRTRLPALGVALAAGVAGVAGSYAVAGSTPAYVVAPVEAALSRAMPGAVVTFAITTFGSLGQQLNLLAATLLVVALVGSVALAGVLAGRRTPLLAGAVGAGLVVGAGAALVTGSSLAGVGTGLPVAVVVGAVDVVGRDAPGATVDPGRRSALGALAAAFAFGALGLNVGNRLGGAAGGGADSTVQVGSADTASLLERARSQSLAVEGLEPLVSDAFYRVDINAVDPDLDAAEWSMRVTGAVEEELTLDYDDLTARESGPEFATLRCVGEPLNGKQMDTALWETVPVAPLLDEAGVGEEDCCVMARAADGYYEEFSVSALRNASIAYGMNGQALPRPHGAPARLLVPGHWGEINVKWLTELEILEEEATGYWEERGWHGTGPVNTVAKLHVVNTDGEGVEVAGHAYAGTRGISRVEVSTDGGETWADADLSEPLSGPNGEPAEDAWRQWAYRYDAPGGDHEVVVRAYDGDGAVQPREEADAFPSGASGWVSRTVSP